MLSTMTAKPVDANNHARIAELGGPEKVRALYKQLFDSTNNHQAE